MSENDSELRHVIGQRLPVSDDGFVRLVDYMGSDQAVVQAARVSYGAGTRQVSNDRSLIRYLMRHRHTTPFEMCEVKLHVRVPMDTWRQWIRHRTANVNEYSTRYSVAIDSMATTHPDAWRLQDPANKQGSGGVIDVASGAELTLGEAALHELARSTYKRRLAIGVSREQARKDLPLSTYTEAYWKIDLHNLLHFLELRLDPAAQLEIRRYAEVIAHEILARWCPLVWEAFTDYRLSRVEFSRIEAEAIKFALAGEFASALAVCSTSGLVRVRNGQLEILREGKEFARKLQILGVDSAWLGL